MELSKHRLLLAVVEGLDKHGSWTGKTHVQKTIFLLDAAHSPRMPFEFVLYKHGPYSFDIESELQEMQSYDAIVSHPVATGYGVMMQPSHKAGWLKDRVKLSLDQEQEIEAMCKFVNTRRVAELEQLATAAWIRSRENITDPERIAERLHELKPHISIADALQADKEIAPKLQSHLV